MLWVTETRVPAPAGRASSTGADDQGEIVLSEIVRPARCGTAVIGESA